MHYDALRCEHQPKVKKKQIENGNEWVSEPKYYIRLIIYTCRHAFVMTYTKPETRNIKMLKRSEREKNCMVLELMKRSTMKMRATSQITHHTTALRYTLNEKFNASLQLATLRIKTRTCHELCLSLFLLCLFLFSAPTRTIRMKVQCWHRPPLESFWLLLLVFLLLFVFVFIKLDNSWI